MKTGWARSTIMEAADFVSTGPFGSMLHKSDYIEGGVPLVNPINIVGAEILVDRSKTVSESMAATLESYRLTTGDVVVGRRGDIGRCAVVRPEHKGWLCGTGCFFIRPKSTVHPDFLSLLIGSPTFRQTLIDQSTGATMPNLSNATLANLEIPLPPLEEQQRIVAILDEAFEGLARARANAEANLRNAQEFFLSVLRNIFGNSSKKWENAAQADGIPMTAKEQKTKYSRDDTQTGGRDATLRAISGDFSLSVLQNGTPPRKGWKWTRLTDLARLESGHTPSRKHPEYWGGDIPWMGIKDARDHHGGVVYSTLENTNPIGIANSSARILPANTVCLSRTASVGYVTIMGRDMATSQDFVNWVCGDALLPDFLKFLLIAQGEEIRRFASGSVHQTIYFPEVKAFHICHPPISVQRDICAALNAIKDESDALIGKYEAKLQDLGDLRQSLLHKAFLGELV